MTSTSLPARRPDLPGRGNPFAKAQVPNILDAIWSRNIGCWGDLHMDGSGGDGSGDSGGGDGSGGSDGSDGDQNGNATDSRGRDLGYPANTPVEDMNDGQQAAYWRHRSQKHESRTKALTGDRSFDQTKADLEAFQKWQRDQQSPADQALQDRYEQGKADAAAESNTKAATAILRANLTAQGYEGAELDELADLIDVTKFIADGEIDTDRMAATAKKFSKSATDTGRPPRRDFGGGDRGNPGGGGQRGAAGQAALERRFGKKSTTGS